MIPGAVRNQKWDVPSVLAEVRPTTDKVMGFLGPLNLAESELFDWRLCLEESLINAIKYGNRQKREIPVKVEIAYNDKEIFLAIEDQGEGFDPDAVRDPTGEQGLEAFSGRGVYLVRHLMDRVEYKGRGNRVEMVKSYKRARV